MGPHRSAAVLVRIDQRRQRRWAFDRGIELNAKLAHEIQIRTETGRDDKLVDADVAAAARRAGTDDQARPADRQVRDPKLALNFDPLRCHERGKGCAKFATRRELVVGAAAISFRRIVSAQQPNRAGLRRHTIAVTACATGSSTIATGIIFSSGTVNKLGALASYPARRL